MTTSSIATPPPPDFRSHVKNISHQSSVFLMGTVFSTAASYFFKIYLARVLGAEALGIYALGMTVVGLAGVLAAGGLPQAATRFVAVYTATAQPLKLGRFLWSSLGVLIITNLIVGGVVLLIRPWIVGPLYHTPSLAAYLPYFILIMLTGALTGFLGLALAGFKDVARRTVITTFVGQTLTMAFSVALLAAGFGLAGYLVAQIAGAVIVLLLLAWATWRLSPQAARRPSFGLPILEPEVVSFSVTFLGVQSLTFLLGQTDRILLGVYINPREVGIYSIAAALVGFVPLALQSVNQIFSPTIAELHSQGDIALLARLFRSLVKWTLVFTLPLAAVMILFAHRIMELFGPEFAPGWSVVVVGTLGQLVNCAVGSVGFLLLMSGQEKQMLKNQTVMTVLLVSANIVLIPRMGLLGAALAGAAVTIISNLWYLAAVRRSLGIWPSLSKYRSLLLPTAMMTTAVLMFRHYVAAPLPAWAAILAALTIGYVVFFGASLLGLDADDRVIAQAVWSRIVARWASLR